MQETEKWTMNHFTFYFLSEVNDWIWYMQILHDPGKILHNKNMKQTQNRVLNRDTENSCNFNRPLSYYLYLISFTSSSNLPMEASLHGKHFKRRKKRDNSVAWEGHERKSTIRIPAAPKFSFNHLPPQTPTMQATGLSVTHKMQTES